MSVSDMATSSRERFDHTIPALKNLLRELECIQSRESDDAPATKEHEIHSKKYKIPFSR